jgi:hypothetical protein
MMSHPLLPKLRQLRLSGILNTLEVRVTQAVDQQLAARRRIGTTQPKPAGIEARSLRMRQQQNPGSF